MRERGMDPRDCFAIYWEQVHNMTEQAAWGIDCLAHLDFPKRYFPELAPLDLQDDGLFEKIQTAGLVLEVNTSSLRRGLAEPLPGEALLRQYMAHGGQYFTIGSDAHRASDLYADVPEARQWAQDLGLRPVWFEERRMHR
jgi:histidinol-phosphatase (PHP family)